MKTITRIILAITMLAAASCATTHYKETRIDADGGSYSYEYSAKDANPLGKTETAAKDFSYQVDADGASKVNTGQSFEGMDNTPAGAIVQAAFNALVEIIKTQAAPIVPVTESIE